MAHAANSVHLPVWLIAILVASLILRIPSFFEPYSYGDETIYLTLGEAMRQGKILYTEVHDNKPPLLYLTAAISGNLFWFKTILTFWSFITIVLFWKLVEALFPGKKRLHQVSTLTFALLTTLPLLEGNIANAENFMIGLTIGGFLILLTKKLSPKNIFLAGVLFSLATLFKVPAAFDAPVIVFYWLITQGFKNTKEIVKRTIFLVLGFAIPIALTFVYYGLQGAFKDYLIAGFLQNFGYLSTFRPTDVQKPFLVKNAPMIIRGLLVLLGIGVLYKFRNKLSKQFIFITAWLFLTLFAVTLSERPYPHYLLQSTAAVSLLTGMLMTIDNLEQSLVILPLAIFISVPIAFHFWYYSTTAYYQRFLSFAWGRITKEEYLAKFGGHVPGAYEISQFVAGFLKQDDGLFVWGPENQTIYALTRRFPPIKYVAQYHINDFSSHEAVMEALSAKPPRVIVILNSSENFPELNIFLQDNYLLIKETNGGPIYLRSTLK